MIRSSANNPRQIRLSGSQLFCMNCMAFVDGWSRSDDTPPTFGLAVLIHLTAFTVHLIEFTVHLKVFAI